MVTPTTLDQISFDISDAISQGVGASKSNHYFLSFGVGGNGDVATVGVISEPSIDKLQPFGITLITSIRSADARGLGNTVGSVGDRCQLVEQAIDIGGYRVGVDHGSSPDHGCCPRRPYCCPQDDCGSHWPVQGVLGGSSQEK
ncbi:hypothetical protein DIRU0_D26940 [Diutina rugosa]